jgi:hypothetical protein
MATSEAPVLDGGKPTDVPAARRGGRRNTDLREAPSDDAVPIPVDGLRTAGDGHGYPDGLAGDEASRGARILTVCDSYNAMTSERPYAAAMSTGDALAELRRCSRSQFDPHVVDTFHTVMARRSQNPNAAGSAPALAQPQR